MKLLAEGAAIMWFAMLRIREAAAFEDEENVCGEVVRLSLDGIVGDTF